MNILWKCKKKKLDIKIGKYRYCVSEKVYIIVGNN